MVRSVFNEIAIMTVPESLQRLIGETARTLIRTRKLVARMDERLSNANGELGSPQNGHGRASSTMDRDRAMRGDGLRQGQS